MMLGGGRWTRSCGTLASCKNSILATVIVTSGSNNSKVVILVRVTAIKVVVIIGIVTVQILVRVVIIVFGMQIVVAAVVDVLEYIICGNNSSNCSRRSSGDTNCYQR
jgi:hypothetical protein